MPKYSENSDGSRKVGVFVATNMQIHSPERLSLKQGTGNGNRESLLKRGFFKSGNMANADTVF